MILFIYIYIYIFLQTELCGIKWRKLTWGECNFSAEPLEDPVLSSYARCLAVDILCVWRRVATPGGGGGQASAAPQHQQPPQFDGLGLGTPAAASSTQPPLSLHAAKELWIFWYGEEPDLSGLVSPELIAAGESLIVRHLPVPAPVRIDPALATCWSRPPLRRSDGGRPSLRARCGPTVTSGHPLHVRMT